jgi:hypothetical protein
MKHSPVTEHEIIINLFQQGRPSIFRHNCMQNIKLILHDNIMT